MLKKMLSYFTLPLLLLLSNSSGNSAPQTPRKNLEGPTGNLERMIVARGNVVLDLDLNRLKGIEPATQESKRESFHFEVSPNSFFTILVFNNVLRGPEPGSMGLIWGNSAILPEPLQASSNQLVIEKLPSSEPFELVVRDGKTGFVFFNMEGNLYEYDAAVHLLSIKGGRLLISEEFANKLGRPAEAGAIAGEISISTAMYPIEITTVVNGAVHSLTLPPRSGGARNVPTFAPGPDVIVGDLSSLQQLGSSGTQVGLAMGSDSCNNGDVELDFFAMPNTDHPVMPQNLYRMSGGATNDDRFEQVGQSWLPHAFFALQNDDCGFGCTPASNGTHLGVGCSNADTASLNGSQSNLGSRAWVNPFTGVFPSTANNHAGHTHTGTTHRILVEGSDLNTTMNPGATYYAEAQFVTPHEYAWCQGHLGQCNMYNNASYRRFNVTGTTSFTFSAVGSTVRMTPAINAWTGATIQTIEPESGVDGRAFIAYKVTGPFGVENRWHYEYAIYNQNLDRGIQSFSVPGGCGMGTPDNLEFHAPLNHPGIANDGTLGDAGYSNAAWTAHASSEAASWDTETFAQNQNANALRWGTLYNFRFDTGTPPTAANATIGFFKTGTPITVTIQGPSTECTPTATPTPPPSPTATATDAPTATPTPTGTPSPTPTATATATPNPCNSTIFRETFDGVTAPALPVSWAASFTPGAANCTPAGTCALGTNWGTSASSPDTAPNCVFHDDPGCVTDSNLDTPSFYNFSHNQFLYFRHNYDLERGFDGAVLEISINGAAFIDFVAAGGIFQSGGYNGTISSGTLSPIAGRPAWTGNSGGYIMTSARMPTPLGGTQTVVLRFRLATDCSGTGTGWRVDTVESVYYSVSCQSPTPTPTPPSSPTPTTKAINLSTRMRVQTGDNVGIGGFIITGTTPKHVLLRAIGPSLTQFGVPDALADPVMELHGPGAFATITNDNWRDDPMQEALILATGIPPTNDLESAIDATLSAGSYSVVVRGKNDTSGVALIEVYDLAQAVDSKLANLSTRAFVGTSDNIVIAGFMLGGNSGDDGIVVRGLGPSLTAFGVPNALADPTLELRDENGGLLAADNDWQDNPGQAAELTAAGLAPTNQLESGIAITLPPGPYTALLVGLNNGTGVGLVEVYDLEAP